MRVAYGKIGRSMPLSLEKCGSLGGDVEMTGTIKTLAERNPDVEFWLVGRNTGEKPEDVGLPSNVINPWTNWGPQIREERRARGLNVSNLTIDQHLKIGEIFDEVILPTILSMDQIVIWAGQHGTTNNPLPSIRNGRDQLTKPHDWCALYAAYLLRGINRWRDVDPWLREEIWLNSDPRNYLKMRDLKWPLRRSVLSQFEFTHSLKHERFGDPGRVPPEWQRLGVSEIQFNGRSSGMWTSTVQNTYARLEINGLMPGTPFGELLSFNDSWEGRGHFGLFINETRPYVTPNRRDLVRDWVKPLNPAFIHGTWTHKSLMELGMSITSAPWEHYVPKLQSVRTTFTTPASGGGWATAKPWEAFAAGTVCFFHPLYDQNRHILENAPSALTDALLVDSPSELRRRVDYLNTTAGRSLWKKLVTLQREHFESAVADATFAELIEDRIYG